MLELKLINVSKRAIGGLLQVDISHLFILP